MTEAAGALPSTPLRRVPHRELPDPGRLTYVLRQRFSYTYDAPVRDLDHGWSWCRHAGTATSGGGGTRLPSPLPTPGPPTGGTPPAIWSPGLACHCAGQGRVVVHAVVERVGPGTDVLVPAAALTDSRLLRPTRLTAADAAIRRLAATMADQDRLATADRFCAYVHEAIRYAYGRPRSPPPRPRRSPADRGSARTPRMS